MPKREQCKVKTKTLLRGLAVAMLLFCGTAIVLGAIHGLGEVVIVGLILAAMVSVDIRRGKWWKWL